mgnify:CR=1 FL=1
MKFVLNLLNCSSELTIRISSLKAECKEIRTLSFSEEEKVKQICM